MKFFKVIFLFIAFVSCQSNETEIPKNLIPEEELISILADIHIMDAASKQNIIDNNHKIKIKHEQFLGVLQFHNVSKDQFDSTISYHKDNPTYFLKIYEKVENTLKKEQEKFQE